MKVLKLKTAAMVLAAAALSLDPAAAQTADQSAAAAQAASGQPGVLGYLDAKTGAFRPVVQETTDTELAAASVAPTTGKFVYNITITLASSIPSSQQIGCAATAGTTEINNTTFQVRSFREEASVLAKRSGSTATCTVTIPYSWGLSKPSSDSVDLAITVASGATSVFTATGANRYSAQTLGSIKVPANGATTTETLKVTI